MIKTTVIGSYPRVTETTGKGSIRSAIHQFDVGELSLEKLEEVFRENTKRVLLEQEELGIDLVTDGQLRWDDIVTPFAAKIEGFQINGLTRFFNNNVYYRQPLVVSALRVRGPISVESFRLAKKETQRDLKAVLPGPFTFAALSEDRFYHDERTLVLTLAEILNQEALALEKAGATFIQFDEPALVFQKEKISLVLDGIARARKGLTAKVALTTYFGDCDGIFDELLKAQVDVLGLDFVSTNGNLKVLKHQPIQKGLGIGCVDARNTRLEDPRAIRDLLKKAMTLTPELYVSPNAGLEFLPYNRVAQKLKGMVEASRQCC